MSAAPDIDPMGYYMSTEKQVLVRRELGRELRRIREEELQMDQADVAAKAGIHRKTVGNCEKGDNTNFDNYFCMAAAMGVNWGWLNTWALTMVEQRLEAPPLRP